MSQNIYSLFPMICLLISLGKLKEPDFQKHPFFLHYLQFREMTKWAVHVTYPALQACSPEKPTGLGFGRGR